MDPVCITPVYLHWGGAQTNQDPWVEVICGLIWESAYMHLLFHFYKHDRPDAGNFGSLPVCQTSP